MKLEFIINDTGMTHFLLIFEKIGNNPLLIGNVQTDISQLSNELRSTDDVLGKIDESYETERIANELVMLKDMYSDDSEMQYNTNEVTLKKMERRNKKARSKKEAVRSKKGKEICCKERQVLKYNLTAGEAS